MIDPYEIWEIGRTSEKILALRRTRIPAVYESQCSGSLALIYVHVHWLKWLAFIYCHGSTIFILLKLHLPATSDR